MASILSVFGVLGSDGSDGGGGGGGEGESVSAAREATVNAFVSTRDRIREIAAASGSQELMALSDSLRDEVFVGLGVRVNDGAKGTDTWSFAPPDELRREQVINADRLADLG